MEHGKAIETLVKNLQGTNQSLDNVMDTCKIILDLLGAMDKRISKLEKLVK